MIWTLVVPSQTEEIKKGVALFYGVGFEELSEPEIPKIIAGKKINYSAVVSLEPGSEGLEMELADFLSENSVNMKGEFYFIFDSEDQYGVYAYQKGKEPIRLEEPIDDFCEKVGVDLGPFRRKEPPLKRVVKTVGVIEGPTPSEVRKALGITEENEGVYIEQLEGNRVLYYSDHGNIAVNVYNLMTMFPGPIYFLHQDKETGYFSCTILEEGEEKGIFEYPEYITDYMEELPSILGASSPRKIAQNLGISPALLGL